MELLFWLSIELIGFAYFGYPAILWAIARIKEGAQPIMLDPEFQPTVSIIISVAIESTDMILAKLRNTFDLIYPELKKEVIIAADGPTDILHTWLQHYVPQFNFKLSVLKRRSGKEAAQKLALAQATGEIVIFTDASTVLDQNMIPQLVSHFTDPTVGGVDGMTVCAGDDEGLYLKYENKIRELEAQVASLVTFGGPLFAVRRTIIQNNFAPDIQSDFRCALVVVESGYRSVLDRKAIAFMPMIKDSSKESIRKQRTIVRGLNTFLHHTHLLNPFKYGMFSFQLLSHKMLKWLVPFGLILALATNAFIVVSGFGESLFYSFLLMLQGVFYYFATAGMNNADHKAVYFRIPGFFLMANLAILKAWCRYVRGERFVMWDATVR